jgi:hypothetical protein
MKNLTRMKRFALLAGSLAVGHGSAAPIEVGKPFPTIVFPAADDNRPMSVAGYRGGKLLLHLFASW